MAAVAEPRSTTKQPSTPLKVFIDLCLKKRTLDNFLTYFLRWVEQRKTSVHLCCKKLKIVSMPMDNIVKVLSMVQLDCIQEVQVSCTWNLSTLATFAPLLGEMSNLQRLRLSHVHVSAFKKQEHDHVVQITSQFRSSAMPQGPPSPAVSMTDTGVFSAAASIFCPTTGVLK